MASTDEIATGRDPAEARIDIAARLAARLGPDATAPAVLHLVTNRFGRMVERDLEMVLQPAGIDRTEYSTLVAAWLSDGPISPTRLSTTIVQTKSGMSKTLRRLEKKGLVERVSDPADGRAHLVELTEDGRRVVAACLRRLSSRWELALDGLGGDDVSGLTAAIRTLSERLDASGGVGDSG